MPAEATPKPVPVEERRRRDEDLDRRREGRDLGRVRLVFLGDAILQRWDPTTWDLSWGGLSPLGLRRNLTQGALVRCCADGRISAQVLFDGLHLTRVGYAIPGRAIRVEVQRLTGE